MGYDILNEVEYNSVWNRFYSQFMFKPDYHERLRPAIHEPVPSIVYRFKDEVLDQDIEELDASFRRCFAEIAQQGRLMYALDWQHESYRFDPNSDWSDLPIGVFPDGDYYIFLTDDFTCGTFGHPWQGSLCVFGERLISLLELDRPAILESVLRANT